MPDASIRLILASRSPRRAGLLRAAGFDFEQADPPFVDPPQPTADGAAPTAIAERLARQKALSLRTAFFGQDVLILAADTIAVGPDGGLIGTPETEAEAKAMLRAFVGRPHAVITGVALLRPDEPHAESFADGATVHMGHVADAEIDRYLATGAWRGKAGGYNLTERQAAGWPLRVEGDPTSVVGLPMGRLPDALERHGVRPGASTTCDP